MRLLEPKFSSRHVDGFTLIEALVALVVLSVGMLGILRLYVQSLGAARATQNRTQAVNLLADISDRIRVNRLGEAAYAGAANDNGCDPSGGPPVDCTPDEMAAQDLYVWGQQVDDLLPDGDWTIAFDDTTTPPTYSIEVSWVQVGQADRATATLEIQVPTF